VITVSGHSNSFYNGDYVRDVDWYDLPHYSYENADGTAHLYYRYSSYLQLDYRDQMETGYYDYYAGGYSSA